MCAMRSEASSGPDPRRGAPPVKVAVLGGSSAYTPALADGLARAVRNLPDLEVRLHGRNEERLAVVCRFCNRLARRRCVPHEYTRTLSVAEACRGARVIVNQMRVGGWAGRSHDDTFPLAFGLPGDETIGPGGLASAVRSVPVVLAAAREAAAAAPGAWFVNMTNPLGILLAALWEVPGLKPLGLCELPGLTLERALALIGVAPDAEGLEKDYLGVNHQGWFVRLRLGGEDLLPRVFDRAGEPEAAAFFKVAPEVMRRLGALPLPYLRIYYHTAREAARAKARHASRGEELADLSRRLYAAYAADREGMLPDLIRSRGLLWIDTALVPALAALLGGEVRREFYVSERNEGYIPGLPAEAVVEKRARLGPGGVEPFSFHGPPPEREGSLEAFLSFLEAVHRFEVLALAAAEDPRPERIVEALCSHPLGIDRDTARALTPLVLRPVEGVGVGPNTPGEERSR